VHTIFGVLLLPPTKRLCWCISPLASLQEFTEAVTRSYKSGQAVSLPLLD